LFFLLFVCAVFSALVNWYLFRLSPYDLSSPKEQVQQLDHISWINKSNHLTMKNIKKSFKETSNQTYIKKPINIHSIKHKTIKTQKTHLWPSPGGGQKCTNYYISTPKIGKSRFENDFFVTPTKQKKSRQTARPLLQCHQWRKKSFVVLLIFSLFPLSTGALYTRFFVFLAKCHFTQNYDFWPFFGVFGFFGFFGIFWHVDISMKNKK